MQGTVVDVADASGLAAWVAATAELLGGIDVVVRVDLPPVARAAWLDGLGQPETTATARLAAPFLVRAAPSAS